MNETRSKVSDYQSTDCRMKPTPQNSKDWGLPIFMSIDSDCLHSAHLLNKSDEDRTTLQFKLNGEYSNRVLTTGEYDASAIEGVSLGAINITPARCKQTC